MMYEITIEEIYEVDGKDYPKKVEIYKQQIANVNVSETVKFLNRGETAVKVAGDFNALRTTC